MDVEFQQINTKLGFCVMQLQYYFIYYPRRMVLFEISYLKIPEYIIIGTILKKKMFMEFPSWLSG